MRDVSSDHPGSAVAPSLPREACGSSGTRRMTTKAKGIATRDMIWAFLSTAKGGDGVGGRGGKEQADDGGDLMGTLAGARRTIEESTGPIGPPCFRLGCYRERTSTE